MDHTQDSNIERDGQPMPISLRAAALANKTEGAYSANRYADWTDVAATLLARGFTDEEAQAIMESKHMRWAADNVSDEYGTVPASAITAYLDAEWTEEKLQRLMAGGF